MFQMGFSNFDAKSFHMGDCAIYYYELRLLRNAQNIYPAWWIIFFSNSSSTTMMTTSSRWAIAFLHKCHYKWQPRKCRNLDMVNLIIILLKNDKVP